MLERERQSPHHVVHVHERHGVAPGADDDPLPRAQPIGQPPEVDAIVGAEHRFRPNDRGGKVLLAIIRCTSLSPSALVTAYGSCSGSCGKSSSMGVPPVGVYVIAELRCTRRRTPAASAARQTFSVPVTCTA